LLNSRQFEARFASFRPTFVASFFLFALPPITHHTAQCLFVCHAVACTVLRSARTAFLVSRARLHRLVLRLLAVGHIDLLLQSPPPIPATISGAYPTQPARPVYTAHIVLNAVLVKLQPSLWFSANPTTATRWANNTVCCIVWLRCSTGQCNNQCLAKCSGRRAQEEGLLWFCCQYAR
jgi:hypothetical protein